MTNTTELKARQNPTCQRYRELSLEMSRRLRGKLKGFTYKRQAVNPYRITLSKVGGRVTYSIWFWGWAAESVNVHLDRRSRKSRGITTDPDLKVMGTGTVDGILNVLRQEGVI